MTSLVMPICLKCTHFPREDFGYGYRCAAFPGGIPDAIIQSEVDHRQPVDGDHGVQFDPIDSRGAAYAARLFGDDAVEPPVEADVAG